MSEDSPGSRELRGAGPSVDASNIPVLNTQRLQLRAFTLGDLPAACALWADEAVVRFIGGKPRTQAEVWTAVARGFGHWALLGYGFWVIADKATNAYLGEIGYLEALRDLKPPHTGEWIGAPEAGWALSQQAWGQGIASEALEAINLWSDRNLDAKHTLCLIDPDHAASLRVAEKNGYQQFRMAQLGEEPTVVLTRLRQSGTLT